MRKVSEAESKAQQTLTGTQGAYLTLHSKCWVEQLLELPDGWEGTLYRDHSDEQRVYYVRTVSLMGTSFPDAPLHTAPKFLNRKPLPTSTPPKTPIKSSNLEQDTILLLTVIHQTGCWAFSFMYGYFAGPS